MQNVHSLNVHTFVKNGTVVSLNPPVGSVWQMLCTHADKQSTQTAIIAVDTLSEEIQLLTYQELLHLVIRCANYLYSKHHVRKGTHFGFAYDNRVEVLLLSLAGALLGATSVPLDSRRDVVDRMKYKLALTGARVFLTHSRGSGRDAWSKKIRQLRAQFPAIAVVEFSDDYSLLDELTKYETDPIFPVVKSSEQVHVTLFTSGTTADPKGAQLTSANLLFNAHAIQQWLRMTQSDRFAAILPLHHINSTTFSLATLLASGTLVLFSEPPKERFWHFMSQYQITITSIVQRIVYDLLELPEAFESVRGHLALSRIQLGSDVVNPVAAEQFIEKFGVALHQGYGLTETSLRATGVPMGLTREEYLMLVRRNSIGTCLEGANVTVLNEEGHEAREGETGEICIRGPIVMKGYLKNARATETAFAGGWFHTGDVGWYETIFNHRFFFYHSRAKEIIKKGGAMLSPAAIDRTMRRKYSELSDAVSFGFPDRDWGETVWMAVTFKDNIESHRRTEIISEMVELGQKELIPGLPKFEAPVRILDWEIEFPEQPLPRTSTMKVQRARLKEIVVARFPPSSRP